MSIEYGIFENIIDTYTYKQELGNLRNIHIKISKAAYLNKQDTR